METAEVDSRGTDATSVNNDCRSKRHKSNETACGRRRQGSDAGSVAIVGAAGLVSLSIAGVVRRPNCKVVAMSFVAFFVLGGAGEKVTAFRGAKQIIRTSFIPRIAVRGFDRHLEQFPRVVAAICGCIVFVRILVALRLVAQALVLVGGSGSRSGWESSVVAGGRFAFVKARLLNKEALALRRQRSTAIPVVFFAVAFLKSLSACNRGGFAASVVFVRSALVDQFGRAWSFTMVVVEVAHVFVLGSQVRERIKAFDGLGVWVGAGVHVPPHDEPFIFLGFVLERITPHVLAKLFAAAVNFTKRLALWKGATRRVRLLRTEYGGCEDGSGGMKAVAIAVGKGGKHCRVWVVQKEGDGCGKRSCVGTVHDQVAAVVCKRRTPFAGVNLIKFNG